MDILSRSPSPYSDRSGDPVVPQTEVPWDHTAVIREITNKRSEAEPDKVKIPPRRTQGVHFEAEMAYRLWWNKWRRAYKYSQVIQDMVLARRHRVLQKVSSDACFLYVYTYIYHLV